MLACRLLAIAATYLNVTQGVGERKRT